MGMAAGLSDLGMFAPSAALGGRMPRISDDVEAESPPLLHAEV